MDGAGDAGVSGVFRIVFKECLQYGYTAAAVQELDFSVAGKESGIYEVFDYNSKL